MKQKQIVVKKGRGRKPMVRQGKKHDPFPPRWWKDGKGRELNDRGDDRAWLDW